MVESLTFFLAVLGYTGLTITAVVAAYGRFPRALWTATAVVIVTHVALVWSVRYDWQFANATRNGYAPFLIFHGALAMIVTSLFVAEPTARRLVWVTFSIVTLGALGAVFSDDAVARYRGAVIVLALAGIVGLTRAALTRRATAGRRPA